MMRRRYDAYRDVVVRPFFRDHFARLDRQIVLVDALAALDGGPEAVRDLQDALAAVLECFRVGRGGWLDALFRPSVDRILFAATKADLLHHSAHDRLEAILKRLTEGADRARRRRRRRGRCHRARRGARDARSDWCGARAASCPSIVGTAVPGEWSDGRHFDGSDRDRAVSRRPAGAKVCRAATSARSASARRRLRRPTTASRRCRTFASTARCNS